MAKKLQAKDDLEILVDKLLRIHDKIAEIADPLLDEETELRSRIQAYMIEYGIPRRDFDRVAVTIGTRKNTNIVDPEQIDRTLTYRGLKEQCLKFDLKKVRDAIGDDALGLETTETKYLIVNGKKHAEVHE